MNAYLRNPLLVGLLLVSSYAAVNAVAYELNDPQMGPFMVDILEKTADVNRKPVSEAVADDADPSSFDGYYDATVNEEVSQAGMQIKPGNIIRISFKEGQVDDSFGTPNHKSWRWVNAG